MTAIGVRREKAALSKGAATDMFDLQPPRHISTLRSPPDVGWRREQTQLTCSSV